MCSLWTEETKKKKVYSRRPLAARSHKAVHLAPLTWSATAPELMEPKMLDPGVRAEIRF